MVTKVNNNQSLQSFVFGSGGSKDVRRWGRKRFLASQFTHLVGYPFFDFCVFLCCLNTLFAADQAVG